MKSESEIRQMVAILEAFSGTPSDKRGRHVREIIALKWVLGEYPPAVSKEAPDAE
jgi:hypothetical protein